MFAVAELAEQIIIFRQCQTRQIIIIIAIILERQLHVQ